MTGEAKPFFPEEMPVALTGVYSMAAPNEAITLYQGPIELEQGGTTLTGTGLIEYQWVPKAEIRFSMDLDATSPHAAKLEKVRLHLVGLNAWVPGCVRGFTASHNAPQKVRGDIDDVELGTAKDVLSIIFHVMNFRDFHGHPIRNQKGTSSWGGRSVIEVDPWRVTLDIVTSVRDVHKGLKELGGYAITHVGKLERVDGQSFAPAESEKVFEALFRYLSFCRGSWVAPILAVGFDESGERVWEKWKDWKIERWQNLGY
jgi:hypothetical protein